MIISIFMAALSVCLLVWIFRMVYVAFIYQKDEREMLIIAKAMSHSFIVLLLFTFGEFMLRTIFYDQWDHVRSSIDSTIHIEPFILYCIILSVAVFINRRRYSVYIKEDG